MLWYGMYVRSISHKENLGTFGSVLDRLEACGKRLNAFRALWERMGAFGRLGRLVSIIPYGMVCMVWYGMVCMQHNNMKQRSSQI